MRGDGTSAIRRRSAKRWNLRRPRPWMAVRTVVLLAAVLAAVTACGSSSAPAAPPGAAAPLGPPPAAPASRLLEPVAFAGAVAQPARFTINVHVPFEGRIDGTDLALPYNRIETDAARLPADRGTPLAIYCRSGRMSAIAARALARLGYHDVVELRGGMQAWTAAGLPLRYTNS